MAEHLTEADFQHWKNNRLQSITKHRSQWNYYDYDVAATIATYDQHLISTPNYVPLSFRFVKAILWTETAIGLSDWHRAPMQIGTRTDPGLHDLLTKEHGKLIMPPDYSLVLTESNVPVVPLFNIWAGIGYLLKRFAHYADVPVRAQVNSLQDSDSRKSKLGRDKKPKQANTYLAIVGWDVMTTAEIARRYNGGGDNYYQQKLEFCLTLID
jgi:hypothetical protein